MAALIVPSGTARARRVATPVAHGKSYHRDNWLVAAKRSQALAPWPARERAPGRPSRREPCSLSVASDIDDLVQRRRSERDGDMPKKLAQEAAKVRRVRLAMDGARWPPRGFYSVRSPATRSQKASEDMTYNMIRDPQTFLDEIERRSEHM